MIANATGDLPQFSSSSYTSNTYSPTDVFANTPAIGVAPWQSDMNQRRVTMDNHLLYGKIAQPQEVINQVQQESAVKRRLVQVFVADPNENIPLENCILYRGEQKLTDATDQELYFELDIKGMLDAHNKERVKFKDKKVKERVEYLEPAKIRELKMVVVTIAEL